MPTPRLAFCSSPSTAQVVGLLSSVMCSAISSPNALRGAGEAAVAFRVCGMPVSL